MKLRDYLEMEAHTKSRVQKPGFRRIRMLLHESLGVNIPAGEQGRPTVRVPVLSSTTAPDHSDLCCIATMHFNGGLAVVEPRGTRACYAVV